MKKLSLLFISMILSNLIPSLSLAAETRYCKDMTRVSNFPRLNEDQFKRHVQDKGAVDRILVSKGRRELYLLKDDVVLKTYHVAFGMDPFSAKRFAGDQKTPEGVYSIDYKNPQSEYYLSLHISYPNDQDKAYAKTSGKSPGGDIMIHGLPVNPVNHAKAVERHPKDWTNGCIAMTDEEVAEVYSLVKEDTTIEICKYSEN